MSTTRPCSRPDRGRYDVVGSRPSRSEGGRVGAKGPRHVPEGLLVRLLQTGSVGNDDLPCQELVELVTEDLEERLSLPDGPWCNATRT